MTEKIEVKEGFKYVYRYSYKSGGYRDARYPYDSHPTHTEYGEHEILASSINSLYNKLSKEIVDKWDTYKLLKCPYDLGYFEFSMLKDGFEILKIEYVVKNGEKTVISEEEYEPNTSSEDWLKRVVLSPQFRENLILRIKKALKDDNITVKDQKQLKALLITIKKGCKLLGRCP